MEGSRTTTRFEGDATPRDEQGIVGLLRQLRDETMTLLRQEVVLAKTEMSEKASRTGRNVGYLAAGGMVAYAGVILLLLAASALVAWLFTFADLSIWVSAMLGLAIVGGIVAAIGYALVQKAISTLKQESPVPEKTIESLKEDKQWIQNKVA